jgi:hypothetical protein
MCSMQCENPNGCAALQAAVGHPGRRPVGTATLRMAPCMGQGKGCHLHSLPAVTDLVSVASLPTQGSRARIEMEGYVE